MPFVLDASVATSWVLAEEEHPTASEALRRLRSDTALVPQIWWFEIRNALVTAERRGRIAERGVAEALASIGEIDVAVDSGLDETTLMALARRRDLTVYDASYLELASRRGCELATLDSRLHRAAAAEGVSLLAASGG
jgi:predicted nucleic acid-binding protein